jgi:hypothetical protein
MAIIYTYLVPDSDFTADSLNLRFDAAVGAGRGINALTLEDLCLGALRHNHLPRLVLQDGIADETTYADITGLGSGSRNIFSTMNHTAFSSTTTVTSTATSIVDVSYNALPSSISLGLGMDTDSQVGAILVLANVDLTQIVVTATDTTGTDIWDPNEDEHYGLFFIRITDSSSPPKSHILQRTYRAMSPRVTISTKSYDPTVSPPVTYHYPGLYNNATGKDKLTNQDVSIRTVIMPSDLTADGLSDVAKIELMAQAGLGPTADWTSTLKVGKSNLTAIPLHTKLNQL